ncbi:MAG TPA: Lrp/AsnC family transcriptional regulator [Ilumatobacteraceae bacterium]
METLLDDLDRALIGLLRREPHLAVVEVARRLGVARGTAQARLTRLERDGVVEGYGPDLSRRALGYGVLAFTTLEIAQGNDTVIIAGLEGIREVLEVHAVTGPGDLLCRIVAHSNDHLREVLARILALPGINRAETHLALGTPVSRTLADVVAAGTVAVTS